MSLSGQLFHPVHGPVGDALAEDEALALGDVSDPFEQPLE
jgi:hypothetical protein